MIDTQEIIEITANDLIAKAKQMSEGGYRISQIGCTKCESDFEVNYSFDKDLAYTTFRVRVADHGELPSISGVYLSACLYENEIHDLFGISFKGMAIDFKGNFYRTAQKEAFRTKSV